MYNKGSWGGGNMILGEKKTLVLRRRFGVGHFTCLNHHKNTKRPTIAATVNSSDGDSTTKITSLINIGEIRCLFITPRLL